MTIQEDLAAVMGLVQAVRKDSRNDQQGFNFRGIDSVVNAVGPALRERGVVVMPDLRAYEYGTVEVGRNRTPMAHVRVTAAYTFVAADGTSLTAVAPGEAMDSGDKATPKAMSVAYRTALLQALCIPTDDPDPDSQVFERSAPPETVTGEVRDAIRHLAGSRGVGDLRAFVIETIRREVRALTDMTVDEGSAVMARLIAMAEFTPAEPATPTVEAHQAEVRQLKEELQQIREDAAPAPRVTPPPATSAHRPSGRPITVAQRALIMGQFSRLQIVDRDDRLSLTASVIGRPVESTNDLTTAEASRLIDQLTGMSDPVAAAAAVAADAIEVEDYPDPDPDQYGSP